MMTKQNRRSVQSKKTPPFVSSRWLIGAVVAVAVVAVLGAKLVREAKGTSLAEVDGLVERASPAVASSSAKAATPPFAQGAAAQVDWVLENGQPAMLLFRSTDCKPCIEMHRLVTKVRSDYQSEVFFIDVIVSDAANYALIRHMGVRMIPTSFFIGRDGQARQAIGVLAEKDLRAALEALRTGP